jgi:hypothetical protein
MGFDVQLSPDFLDAEFAARELHDITIDLHQPAHQHFFIFSLSLTLLGACSDCGGRHIGRNQQFGWGTKRDS